MEKNPIMRDGEGIPGMGKGPILWDGGEILGIEKIPILPLRRDPRNGQNFHPVGYGILGIIEFKCLE